MSGPAVIALTAAALPLARRIRALIGAGEVHGLARRCEGADVAFDDTMPHLRALFAEARPIVGVCAAGILVRALGPRLCDKRDEPPVLAVAEDGSAVVPLLGGHRGANDLARRIAEGLGGIAAVTTAGDLRFATALDAPPPGWTLANPEHAKAVMAALLDGAAARVFGVLPWLDGAGFSRRQDGAVTLIESVHSEEALPDRLIYHPARLALGVGCERHCPPDVLVEFVDKVLEDNLIATATIACVVSLDLKADEAAVHALARHLGVPVRFVAADDINAIADRLANPSEVVMREVGCPGVAEGAALVAAGPQGELLIEKLKSERCTCAVSLAPDLIDAAAVGRARGRVSVVGLGPGAPAWRAPEAAALLGAATDWVGYGLYLDLAADLRTSQAEHRFALGEEEARVRHALELAGEGRDVALVCSGDPGIYAMASLVFELLDDAAGGKPVSAPARRAEIVVVPGISAFQAAAARAGAPVGHDFCAISLSDLLTPWETIERRLRAAAEGDFVCAFYNPRSMRRRDQLERALEILREHRPPETPVIVASDLGRDKERVRTVPLARFDPGEVDMLTLVIVGASTTRTLQTGDGRQWTWTPRGYDKKRKRQ